MWKESIRSLAGKIDFPAWPSLLRAVTGRLPLRQGRAMGSAAWAETHGASWSIAAQAMPAHWPGDLVLGPPFDYRMPLPDAYPDWGVLRASGLIVMGPDGWILDREGTWLPDHSWFSWRPDRAPARDFTPSIHRLPGLSLSLCSDWAATNYFHFILDSMSRLAAIDSLSISLDSIDRFLLPAPCSGGAERILDDLGIPAGRRVYLHPGMAVEPETLLAPGFPGNMCAVHPVAVRYMQRIAQRRHPVSSRRQRLFVIRRAANRLLENESEVAALLETLGFELFDPAEAADQMASFAQAEAIVGVHGAALANLSFCAPDTPVVEIMPSDHAFPYFRALASGGGLRYRAVVAASIATRPIEDLGASPYNFRVDMQTLRKALVESGLL